MAETPTFGRYAEIPYEQMTPEQQEGYRSLIETRGRLPGPGGHLILERQLLLRLLGRRLLHRRRDLRLRGVNRRGGLRFCFGPRLAAHHLCFQTFFCHETS